jgi:hypothetical protein
MEEVFVHFLLGWLVAGSATLFAVAHLGESAAARAVLGGTVGAIVGVLLAPEDSAAKA